VVASGASELYHSASLLYDLGSIGRPQRAGASQFCRDAGYQPVRLESDRAKTTTRGLYTISPRASSAAVCWRYGNPFTISTKANGADAGALGLPVTEDLLLANGLRQQTFEGGRIEYNPTTGIAVLQPANLESFAGAKRLHSYEPGRHTRRPKSQSMRAAPWSPIAPLRGIHPMDSGSGSAERPQRYAYGYRFWNRNRDRQRGGKDQFAAHRHGEQRRVAKWVRAHQPPPSSRAFEAAVTRDKLIVQLPAASTVMRIGNGYVQQLSSTGTPPVSYLIAEPDGSAIAYVVTGRTSGRLYVAGRPDWLPRLPRGRTRRLAAGRLFKVERWRANPVQLVTAAILTKWGTLGYETGVAGSPTERQPRS